MKYIVFDNKTNTILGIMDLKDFVAATFKGEQPTLEEVKKRYINVICASTQPNRGSTDTTTIFTYLNYTLMA